MKNLIKIISAAAILISCKNGEFSQPEFGKTPIQLQNNDLKIDIPKYFSDEKYFENNDDGLRIEVEEEYLHTTKGNLGEEYVDYSVTDYENKKKVPLLKYGSINFPFMTLSTDNRDEKVLRVIAENDSLTSAEHSQLLKDLEKDLGKADQPEQNGEIAFYEDRSKKIWKKKDRVVSVSFSGAGKTEYDEQGNPIDDKNTLYEAKLEIWRRDFYDKYFVGY